MLALSVRESEVDLGGGDLGGLGRVLGGGEPVLALSVRESEVDLGGEKPGVDLFSGALMLGIDLGG